MRGRGAPYLVPSALAAAALAALGLSWDRILACGAGLESPATQIGKALASQQQAVLTDVYGFQAGGTLALQGLRFEDVVPSLEGGRATVVAMVTGRGTLQRQGQPPVEVAYVGRERFHMHPCAIARWCGESDQLGRLRGVLLALLRHRDALERRDPEAAIRLLAAGRLPEQPPEQPHAGGEGRQALERRLRQELASAPEAGVVRGWQIRVERDQADVGEDLDFAAPGRPPRSGRRVYKLVLEGSRWAFAGGV
jgi:hypothetical protein